MARKAQKKPIIHSDTLHWVGFFMAMILITALTAYGFLLSLRPSFITFDSAPETPLALVGVALVNNIGTNIPRENDIPVTLPEDMVSVQQSILTDPYDDENFFVSHFILLDELREILELDVVSYLDAHTDKTAAFEAYVLQLDEYTDRASQARNNLIRLRDLHVASLPSAKEKIKNLEGQVESAYVNRDVPALTNTLVALEEARIEEQEHSDVVLFSRQMIAEYDELIDLSNQKLTVLRANADALVKGVTVTLPKGININALKNLKIFTTN